jgi:hypothetical protein
LKNEDNSNWGNELKDEGNSNWDDKIRKNNEIKK